MLLSTAQVPLVRAVLDAHGIRYWEDEIFISIDGEPEKTSITFSINEDATKVQRLLDSAP
jgi:hypothetical protein